MSATKEELIEKYESLTESQCEKLLNSIEEEWKISNTKVGEVYMKNGESVSGSAFKVEVKIGKSWHLVGVDTDSAKAIKKAVGKLFENGYVTEEAFLSA